MDDNALYQLHQRAIESLRVSGSCFNWHIDFECEAKDLPILRMEDVAKTAEEWRAEQATPSMYFTHRQYYKDGPQHIIDELKFKSTSHRALYSLLAQSDISGSKDTPIPSFLTFQCSIENGNTLYCTATFRALEVTKFLRINLEEIRQNLHEITSAIPVISKIHLHVFAFHAYCDSTATSLRRPDIELLGDDELLLIMQDGDVNELDRLLGGLQGSTTVVSSTKLEALNRMLSKDPSKTRLSPEFDQKRRLLIDRLDAAIQASKSLATLRQGASRGSSSENAIQLYQSQVKDLRRALFN